jgi:hypothetical protein
MNALTTTAPAMNYSDLERLAESIAKSGLFGMKTKDQAIALMMIAHAEGTHPALAARDYDVIQGRPAKKAEAMMRDFLQAGGKVEWHAMTDELADATFTHPQTGSVRVDWDMERAKTAGMAGKDNWKKFPRQMLRSRVVSEGVRTLWPLATSGMYVPEETADMPSKAHNGPTLEAEPDARDAMNATVPLRAAAAPMPKPARVVDPEVYEAPQHTAAVPRTRGQFLDALSIALNDAKSAEEADRILCSEDVMRAKEAFTNGLKERLDGLISRALAKWWAEPPEELPEVEIEGADRVGAG